MRNEFTSGSSKSCRPSIAKEELSVRKTDDRHESRYAAEQLLWLVRADGARWSATMINVSRAGFGLKVSHVLRPGERVLLRGGAGDIPAEIRWSTKESAGGVFILPDD